MENEGGVSFVGPGPAASNSGASASLKDGAALLRSCSLTGTLFLSPLATASDIRFYAEPVLRMVVRNIVSNNAANRGGR